MEVLEIVLPVLAMIILGILCRKWKLLDQSGVNNMKTLVTNIMLPVEFFMHWQQQSTVERSEFWF